MMRAALLLAAVAWWPALGQVKGECGPGRTCTAAKFKATGPGSASVKPAVVSIPADSMVCADGTTPGSACNSGMGMVSSELGLHINGNPYIAVNAGTGALSLRGPIANPATITAVTIADAEGLSLSGVATGSLASCPAVGEGTLQFDTTAKALKICRTTESGWAPVARTTFTARCAPTGACTEGTNFAGAYSTRTTYAEARVVCSPQVAGTGGTTGVVLQLWNESDLASIGTCTLGSCTAGAGAPLFCTITGAVPANRYVTLRLTTGTDCTANPTGFVCNVELSP